MRLRLGGWLGAGWVEVEDGRVEVGVRYVNVGVGTCVQHLRVRAFSTCGGDRDGGSRV